MSLVPIAIERCGEITPAPTNEGRHAAIIDRTMPTGRTTWYLQVIDPGDYEGLHRAPSLDGVPRLQGHECRPWMFHAMPTIGSACAACGRRWPWIEPPALYFGGP